MSRLGLSAGVLLVVGASAFMNVSGWAAMAETMVQRRVNIALSSGFELTALFALPHAGRVMGRGTYIKALMALAIGLFAIGVNIYATQNFLFEQLDIGVNAIEGAQSDVAINQARIDDLERERASIVDRNRGIPRDEQTVRDSYDSLDEADNPINMMRRDSEIGDRRRYDELSERIDDLRQQRGEASITANDEVRSVIPPDQIKNFVTAIEVMKAVGLFVIGNNRIFFGRSYKPRDKYFFPRK